MTQPSAPAGTPPSPTSRPAWRDLAEAQAAQSPALPEPLAPAEIRHLLHELRVHQIELEMQNEELRRTQVQLDTERARYFDLYDLAPVGYITLDQRGHILEANLTAAALLGVTRGELLNKPFSACVYPEDQDSHYRHFQALLATGEPHTCEDLRLIRQDAAPFNALFQAVMDQDPNGAICCRVVISDITAHKQAEEAMRNLLSLHTATLEATADGLLVVDQAGRWTTFNQKFLQLWRIPPEQAGIGDALIIKTYALPQLADPEAFLAKVMALYQHPEESSLDEVHFKDGRVFERYSQPQRLGDEVVGRVWSFRDVTPRVRVEQKLRQTQEWLLAANRELAQAIAIEHDLAHTDELTGVPNHRSLMEQAEQLYDVAQRYHHPLSVLMFDIDNFKEINDTCGHTTGDQVLQQVAGGANGCLRDADILGRYGGDEFVIVLPMTTAQQALPVAERIHAAMTAVRVPALPADLAVTLSIGIADMGQPSQDETLALVINRADEAMYSAKQAGRNRTATYLAALPGSGR